MSLQARIGWRFRTWFFVTGGLSILGLAIIYWAYGRRTPSAFDATPQANIQEHAAVESAFDWPHLRGGRYDAVSLETDLADSWPEEGPPVLWTRELGQGYSGFVVVADRVFTQMQSRTGQYILCLDAETGAPIWQYRYDWPWQPASVYPGPYATPTWSMGRIYFAAPSGQVGCLDANTGQACWSVNVVQQFQGKGTEYGYACTPLVEDGKVILPVGGEGASVVALDAQDGSIVWKSGDEAASYCPAFPISLSGRRYVVAWLRNSLAVLDLKTGRQVWADKVSTAYDEHAAWPLYAEPFLLTASPFRSGARLYRLHLDREPASADLAWDNRELSNDVSSSVLFDHHVYGFDLKDMQANSYRPSRGRFKCLEFGTGKVCWSTERVGHATVLVADGKLILLNDSGTLILASAGPAGYRELGRVQVFQGELCWTPPALSRGRLYARKPSRAVCLYLGKRERLNPQQLRDSITVASLPQSHALDWSWVLPYEREYPFDAPTRQELSLWFEFCVVGVFASAGLLTAAASGACWLCSSKLARGWNSALFWSLAFFVGLIGTTAFSHLRETFILTWPVSLFAVFQNTLLTITWAERQANKSRSRWLSRAGAGIFLCLCFGYYELCKTLGVVMGWSFLAGLLPAWPFGVLAARNQVSRGHWLQQVFWSALAFAVYFWVSGLLPALKARFQPG